MSDLVGNPEDRFSHIEALITVTDKRHLPDVLAYMDEWTLQRVFYMIKIILIEFFILLNFEIMSFEERQHTLHVYLER